MASDKEPVSPPRLTGAYEDWVFGAGAAYANLDIPLARTRFVAATVSLPSGVRPSDFSGMIAIEGRNGSDVGTARALLPLTWRGLGPGLLQPTSWPVILDFQEPERRETLDLRGINQALHDLSEPVVRALPADRGGARPTFRLNTPMPAESVSPELTDAPDSLCLSADSGLKAKLAQGGPLVVMAVIDDGIPFAHRKFRNSADNGTRIEFCWLQSASSTPNGTVLFGREFTRDAINALVAEHEPDEDAIYTRAGVEGDRPHTATVNHFASHGAHVLDAAAGHRSGDDLEQLDLMRIVAVQLPAAVTADTTGFRKDAFVLCALHYIFDRADRIAAAYLDDEAASLPLVINFSYGFTGGPHDGSDTLEIAIAQLIAAREAQDKPTTLVMPSGNSFGDRMNGEITARALQTGMSYAIPWRLQPNDHTASYLEIWLPAVDADAPSFALTLTAPNGVECQTQVPLTFTTARPAQDQIAATLSQALLLAGMAIGQCSARAYNATWWRVLIALAPTEPDDPALPAAPSGRWSVAIAKTGGAELQTAVACRVARDNDPFGYRRGARQSYFDDEADLRYSSDGALSRTENNCDAFVRRFGTLNGLATHDKVTVVAGYYGNTGRATEYGASGRVRANGAEAGAGDVTHAAMSDTSTALRGVVAAGTRSGAAVRMSGTSMAAPQVARALAMQHISQAKTPAQTILLRQPVSEQELSERPTRLG